MSTDNNMNAASYRKALLGLALAAAIATVFLISLGSFVRVTGSGLACPDWPLCHGSIIPPFEYHVLIEYSHRLTASIVGLLIAAMFVVSFLAFRKGEEPTRRALIPAAVTLIVMLTQAGLGGVAVVTELPPPIVTLHLFLAEAILALLIVTMLSATSPASTPGTGGVTARDARKLYLWAVVAAVTMLVMILSGSYVVAEEATLACGSGFSAWPLCDGAIMPKGFDPNIHMGHRFMVVIGTVVTGYVAYLAWRQKANDRMISRVGQATLHLLIVQIIIGALVPWTEFHHAARVAHITLASITWAAAVLLVILAARARANAGEQEEDVEGRASQMPPAPAGGSGAAPTMTLLDVASDYFWLTKPRVMVLLLLTALGGMVLAAQGLPSATIAVAVLLGGALASGGAGAINHGLEANIDAAMLRTRHRPVASGRVTPRMAISYGIALNILAFVVLAGGANVLAASITLSGSLFYVFVYTLWLKQTTVQNIVIGGAAGAVPPLVGWAAVTGNLSLPAIYLFLIIFFWTPPHFWALSIMIKDDYERANVPMMPVILGEESTRTSIFLYTILVNILALLLYISTTPLLSEVYLVGALVLGGIFTYYAYRLLKEKDRAAALRLYKFSLLYLSLLFLAMMVDQLV